MSYKPKPFAFFVPASCVLLFELLEYHAYSPNLFTSLVPLYVLLDTVLSSALAAISHSVYVGSR